MTDLPAFLPDRIERPEPFIYQGNAWRTARENAGMALVAAALYGGGEGMVTAVRIMALDRRGPTAEELQAATSLRSYPRVLIGATLLRFGVQVGGRTLFQWLMHVAERGARS